MQNDEKKTEEVLRPDEMMKDGVKIRFSDTTMVENSMGELLEINAFIPQCCREGWASCKHVVKKQKPVKRNVGL